MYVLTFVDVLYNCVCVLQGQSRRVQVEVRSVQDSGTMPLIAEIILGVSIGCVEIRQARPAKGNDLQQVQCKILLLDLFIYF